MSIDNEYELISLEELEDKNHINFDNFQIKNPFDDVTEEYNSIISELKNPNKKSSKKKLELVNNAFQLLTTFDTINKKCFSDGQMNNDQFYLNNDFYLQQKAILNQYIQKYGPDINVYEPKPEGIYFASGVMPPTKVSVSGATGEYLSEAKRNFLSDANMGGKKKRKSRKRKSKKSKRRRRRSRRR